MQITETGQVNTSMQDLLALRLTHFFSALDTPNLLINPGQHLSATQVFSGYTEWLGHCSLPISIGWDWQVIARDRRLYWHREALPRTNLQLINHHGQTLSWHDNLMVLASWIDAHDWQNEVAQAIHCQSVIFGSLQLH
jgi:Domain of unknown function (DUF4902)